jgi:hypothetical protein
LQFIAAVALCPSRPRRGIGGLSNDSLMTQTRITTEPPTPPELAGPPSRGRRLLTSWKLWLLAFFASLCLLATALAIPAYRRLKAFDYVKQNLDYEMAGDDEWITDRFGEWVMGLRNVQRISTRSGWISTEELTRADIERIAFFSEVRVLEADMPNVGGFEDAGGIVV